MPRTQKPGEATLPLVPTGRVLKPNGHGRTDIKDAIRREATPQAPVKTERSQPPTFNRIRTLMIHAPRYSFQGQARLASDAGVSRSTISRLLGGRINPSFRLAQAVTAALETSLKRSLDPREVISPDGTYPTPSGCELAGCRGCMPEEAYDREGRLRPEYRDLRPGDWSLSRLSPQHPAHQKPAHQNPNNHRKETL